MNSRRFNRLNRIHCPSQELRGSIPHRRGSSQARCAARFRPGLFSMKRRFAVSRAPGMLGTDPTRLSGDPRHLLRRLRTPRRGTPRVRQAL